MLKSTKKKSEKKKKLKGRKKFQLKRLQYCINIINDSKKRMKNQKDLRIDYFVLKNKKKVSAHRRIIKFSNIHEFLSVGNGVRKNF